MRVYFTKIDAGGFMIFHMAERGRIETAPVSEILVWLRARFKDIIVNSEYPLNFEFTSEEDEDYFKVLSCDGIEI